MGDANDEVRPGVAEDRRLLAASQFQLGSDHETTLPISTVAKNQQVFNDGRFLGSKAVESSTIDFNKDGRPDFVMIGEEFLGERTDRLHPSSPLGSKVIPLLALANGTFASIQLQDETGTSTNGVAGTGFLFVNLDGDGLQVLLVSNEGKIYRYSGVGDGTSLLDAWSNLDVSLGSSGCANGIAAGDFNGDGSIDIVGRSLDSPHQLIVYRGMCWNGTFDHTPIATLSTNVTEAQANASSPLVVDLNADGWQSSRLRSSA